MPDQFSRTRMLLGGQAMERLGRAHVALFGVGGVGGFAAEAPEARLAVSVPNELIRKVPEDRREALVHVLALDPRPSYQDDPDRVYGFGFAGLEVKFSVRDGVLSVVDIQ